MCILYKVFGLFKVRKEAAQHSLVYERTANTLPWQHVVIFRKN